VTDTPFVVDRSPWGLVAVHGPDATSYLQSLISQDLDPVEVGRSVRSLLLTPQGKLDAEFRALRAGDEEWWLDTEAVDAPRLAESLQRFRIRVKAEIEDRTAETGMATLVGTSDIDVPGSLHALPTAAGVDVVGAIGEVRVLLETLDATVHRATAAEFEAFRIEAGVPRYGVDIDAKTIPQEAFLERNAIAFTKGCFLGQELVARIDSRGHVNRHLRRIAIDGATVPPAGASVVVDDRDVGTITSVAAVPGEDRSVALGMVRREVEPPADVTLRWDGGEVAARVTAGA